MELKNSETTKRLEPNENIHYTERVYYYGPKQKLSVINNKPYPL